MKKKLSEELRHCLEGGVRVRSHGKSLWWNSCFVCCEVGTERKEENQMKATIEISKKTMDKLAEALDLSPLYDEDGLSYAIEPLVGQVC